MAAKVRDRYGNLIALTDERWRHIVTYHPELEEFLDEVMSRNNFVLTAYGIEKKRRSR